MSTSFLHGVQVTEISTGPRTISTVSSSVIGLVGTGPGSTPAIAATLATGVIASNNALTWTAAVPGTAGNAVTIALINPGSNSASLGVVVTGNAIVVNLATSSGGALTSTAAQVIAAIAGSGPAAALVVATNTSASTGAAAVAAVAATALTGGVADPYPLNTPFLVANTTDAAKFGATGTGTIPDALADIFAQTNAVVVVVKVAVGGSDMATGASVAGVSTTGTGLYALLAAQSVLGQTPRILIAPKFSQQAGTGASLQAVSDRLRAIGIIDGPNAANTDALTAAQGYGDSRLYMVDPWIQVVDINGNTVARPPSGVVAGLIAANDNNNGFWWSPSNQLINGIVGTTRAINFQLGDPASDANLLNAGNVATIIRTQGWRLWGNRSLSSDQNYAFLCVRRTKDLIDDSILRAHLWAVDRGITKTYLDDVTASVNGYLRTLKSLGAIIDGVCTADKDLNTTANIAAGKVFFDIAFTPTYPAENITFRSAIVNNYLSELLA